jgi:hypothetical protein
MTPQENNVSKKTLFSFSFCKMGCFAGITAKIWRDAGVVVVLGGIVASCFFAAFYSHEKWM